jgi:hypothetical protein
MRVDLLWISSAVLVDLDFAELLLRPLRSTWLHLTPQKRTTADMDARQEKNRGKVWEFEGDCRKFA